MMRLIQTVIIWLFVMASAHSQTQLGGSGIPGPSMPEIPGHIVSKIAEQEQRLTSLLERVQENWRGCFKNDPPFKTIIEMKNYFSVINIETEQAYIYQLNASDTKWISFCGWESLLNYMPGKKIFDCSFKDSELNLIKKILKHQVKIKEYQLKKHFKSFEEQEDTLEFFHTLMSRNEL